jgi:hypothetical protein
MVDVVVSFVQMPLSAAVCRAFLLAEIDGRVRIARATHERERSHDFHKNDSFGGYSELKNKGLSRVPVITGHFLTHSEFTFDSFWSGAL